MRRFELTEDGHAKFWEITHDGSSFTVRFGRIGTVGQTQSKSFDDEPKAKTEHDKLVREKVKKGYREIAATPEKADDATPAEAPTVVSPAPVKATKKAVASPPPPPTDDGFLPAPNGYFVGIRDGKLVARNPKGQLLGSVPKDIKESEVGEQLLALVDWLAAHERAAVEWADTWMLRSLPIPAAVVSAVWPDDAYRRALENLVVFPVGKDGAVDPERGGLLRGADPKRGVGVVDREGETTWLAVDEVAIPHPIVIASLDDWRALATELGATQGAQQLFREVFTVPPDLPTGARAIERFAGAAFKQLNHAFGAAKTLGYRVSGGSAVARVLENGVVLEARYWLGDDDPASEASTGSLAWVDDKQAEVPIARVTPIAFSEGMRMASAIHARRVIEKEGDA
jgi:predicted DNA-binding WGR domain protein